MIPQVRAALRRFLEPLTPVKKAADSIDFSASQKNEGGGHGALGYERAPDQEKEKSPAPESSRTLLPPVEPPEEILVKNGHLLREIKGGLTEVVIELHAKKHDHREGVSPGLAADSYQAGVLIRKGAVVDKKAG